MASYTPVLIGADTLSAVVGDIFRANGCDPAEADRIAHHLLGANLAGHDSHGVARVPRYVEWQQAGYVVAGQQAEVVTDGGAFAVLDGHFGFGQTVAPQAAALGIERAQQHGTAIIALRNAGHVGRIGAYAEQAIEAGLISIHFVNVAGSVLVAPFGGTERRFSTNPFCVGVPTSPPVVLDFATSLVAEGKVLVASNGGKALPHDALVEPDGTLSAGPAYPLRRLRPDRPAQRLERARRHPRLRRAQGLRPRPRLRPAGGRLHRRRLLRPGDRARRGSPTACCRSTSRRSISARRPNS